MSRDSRRTVLGPGAPRRFGAVALLCAALLAATVAIGAEAPAGRRQLVGSVLDEATGEPVPFVNIGVPGGAAGTVGAEDGSFKLERVPEGAVVLFSALGYEDREISVAEFSSGGTIEMAPIEIRIQESVAVTAEDPGEPAVIGKKYELPGYGFGFGSSLLGAELGARIRIDGPTFLRSANFVVAHTGGERFLYRVNVYDFDDGEVGENLLDENVIIAAKQEKGTLTVDLSAHRLVVENDVLLSLEWIRDDDGAGNANVMFRARPRTKTALHMKLTSQMPFRPVRRHSLSFYFEGYSLK